MSDELGEDRAATLQRQIVEMRLRMDQQAEANAALMDHAAQRAIAAALGGKQLTEDEREWVRNSFKAETERKRVRSELVLHVLKWGVGGSVGFMLYSAWEQVKASLGSKQ